MKKIRIFFDLFVSMLKIGLFTFGGGYAMISILENEFVNRKRWLDGDEFADLVVIAESTPGPIAINCATYIGYKRAGFGGSCAATLGMVFPSVTIIYFISLFFDEFLSLSVVASAFRGIRVAVIFLILSAGLKMLKKMKKNPFTISVMSLTMLSMVVFGLLSVKFSSIFYIIVSGLLGLMFYGIGRIKDGKVNERESEK